MSVRDDLDANETEILRGCCQQIRVNQWFGMAEDAAQVESSLPPIAAQSVSDIQAPDEN
jgi:hypothetical protein